MAEKITEHLVEFEEQAKFKALSRFDKAEEKLRSALEDLAKMREAVNNWESIPESLRGPTNAAENMTAAALSTSQAVSEYNMYRDIRHTTLNEE